MVVQNVNGKTFLITGGASGLGALFAEAFLKEGAKNIAILDIAEKLGLETAEKLNQTYPGKVKYVKCNVSKEADIKEAFDKVVDDFGKIDVIINNAGIMNDSDETWKTMCDVNVQGLVLFTMKGLKHMKEASSEQRGGTIINISSLLALLRCKYLPIYSGTKAFVLNFSTVLGMDEFHNNTGVRVLTICFGATDTDLLQRLENRSYEKEFGEQFAEETKATGSQFQKPESAVRGMVDMFKHGSCGSVWFSNNDKPAVNITSILDDAYESVVKVIMGLSA